jgi:LEA14-like dessication related protein
MTLIKDMALTLEEFRRDLPIAMRGLEYEFDGSTVRAGNESRGITITIKPLPKRVLSALLSLERSEVAISFSGYDETEKTAFLQRFDRTYQRGGG